MTGLHFLSMAFRCVVLACLLVPVSAIAQSQADVEAIHAVLREYRATQDANDLVAQAALMTPDRIWISDTGQRRTDNAENMRVQQAQADVQKQEVPGLRRFTVDRDVLVRFYGGGSVAVASFYRTAVIVFPAGTPQDLRERHGGYAVTGTLVLEKRGDGWKIVHTHWSPSGG